MMRRLELVFITLIFSFLGIWLTSANQEIPQYVQATNLLIDDHFDSSALDTSVWHFVSNSGGTSYSIDNSILTIHCGFTNGGGGAVQSNNVYTIANSDLTYEARISQSYPNRGYWGFNGSDYASYLHFGVNDQGELLATIRNGNSGAPDNILIPGIDTTTWHTYRIEASVDLAKFYVDGELKVTYTQNIPNEIPLIVNQSKGSTGTDHTISVDYVKLLAGNYPISGYVIDEDGLPLKGVEIFDETGQSTFTDNDGHYEIIFPKAGNYTIHPQTTGYVFSPATCTVDVPVNTKCDDFHAFNIVYRVGSLFMYKGEPFYFGGTNNYYLSYTNTSDIDEIFDKATEMNLKVVRTMGFLEEEEPSENQLDYIIKKADEVGIKILVVLTNNWNAFNFGEMDEYIVNNNMQYHDDFYIVDGAANIAYKSWISGLLNRTNQLTGKKYKDEPSILAWELANEPRCEGSEGGPATSSNCNADMITAWADDISKFIKSIDSNHLLGVGDEGFFDLWYCIWPFCTDKYYNGEMKVSFEDLISVEDIDFGTFHMYPEDWELNEEWGSKWIKNHIISAHQEGKPVILEEFGFSIAKDMDRRAAVYETWTNDMLEGGGNGWLFWMLGNEAKYNLGGSDPYWVDPFNGNNHDVVVNTLKDAAEKISASSQHQNKSSIIMDNNFLLNQGETKTIDVSMPLNVSSAQFSVKWLGSTVDSTLIDPNGNLISPEAANTYQNMYYFKGNAFEVYEIKNPQSGDWQIITYGTNLPQNGESINTTVGIKEYILVFIPSIFR